jgi:hypothetical protein
MNVIPESENIFLSVSNATDTISREEDDDQFTYETPDVVSMGIDQFTYETPDVVSTGIDKFTYETPDVVSMGIDQSPNDELTAKQKQIDKMTLELLVNKRQYRKYLEKHNTAEYEEKENNFTRFNKYKRQIGTLMHDLLNDYSVSGNSAHLGNTEIQDIFEAFIQKTTYFFESKEYETHSFGYHEDDPDTLFETLIDPEDDVTVEPPSISSSGLFPGSFANQFRQGNSFWGKNVVKRK